MPSADDRQAPAAEPPEKSAGGRRSAKSDETRRRICDAAAALIAENGVHRTSIALVVEAARVSPGALLHHFPTKEDLVAATAERLLARSVRWFAGAKGELADGRAAFGRLIRRSWREQFQSAEYAALLDIMAAARTDAALRARLEPKLAGWRRAIEHELATLLPAGMAAEELEAVLVISRCLMTGLLVHDALTDPAPALERTLDLWLALVARAFAGAEA